MGIVLEFSGDIIFIFVIFLFLLRGSIGLRCYECFFILEFGLRIVNDNKYVYGF